MTAYHRRPALGAVRAGFSRSRRGDGLQHFLIAPRLPVPPPAAPPPRPRADRWRCPCLDSQRSYSSGPTHVLLGSAKLLLAAADAKARPRRDFGQVFQWVSVRLACKSTTLGACSGKVDTGFPIRTCADAREAERIPIHWIGIRSGARSGEGPCPAHQVGLAPRRGRRARGNWPTGCRRRRHRLV